jgi:hypothetical protein
LLAQLAARHPCAFWFADADPIHGAESFAAQLIALAELPIPVVPPAVSRNPAVLEKLLLDVARQPQPPLLLLDMPAPSSQPLTPLPLPLPAALPTGLRVIYGVTPEQAQFWPADATLTLPASNAGTETALLARLACPKTWWQPLRTAAAGNLLYLRLASDMLHRDQIPIADLPTDLEALHATWWDGCTSDQRRLALLVAATSDTLPQAVAADLLGIDPTTIAHGAWLIHDLAGYRLAHWYTRAFLARHHGPQLARAHFDYVALALKARMALANWNSTAQESSPIVSPESPIYLSQHLSRHVALSVAPAQREFLPRLAQRHWAWAQERAQGNLASLAHDMAWELAMAVADKLPRMVRAAVLAGTYATRARSLAASTVLAALPLAQGRLGREQGLKQLLELVEQLADGRDKAHILRQLGEACYGLKMRTSAMRLLSRALDLEEQPLPRAWREQREQLHTALVQAALDLNDVELALATSARIAHKERRGMAETSVVRWLLAHGQVQAAAEVARAIAHENLGAWACAEVAVALARGGDVHAAELLLAQNQVDTAVAWAQIELACDDAANNEQAARTRIESLASPHQRDRGLARLAHALALADKDGDALDAAEQIGDIEVRVSALLDLRLQLDGLVAMLALEAAARVIGAITGDARVPLMAALAAAHAALGKHDRAMQIAEQLHEGEERDRALSRMALACARQGDDAQSRALVQLLTDDDERDWALDELVRLLAERGQWPEAQALVASIRADDQRARTLAELCIAQARGGAPAEACQHALAVAVPGERTRALVFIAPLLVAAGELATALQVVEGAVFSNAAEVSRYLTAVTIALAEQRQLEQAEQLVQRIARPTDQARGYLALAHSYARSDATQAQAALGAALRVARLGREEAFKVLEQATPVLGLLGCPALLAETAAMVDEIDGWF